MDSTAPVVSVCIPTWNRSELLALAIDSVLAQSFCDFELIIMDNVSTDDTEQVVKEYSDSRIVYVKNEKHVSMVDNWQRCLNVFRGSYISIFADDDLMEPDNLKEKVAFLERFQRVGLVHSRYHVIDQFGHSIKSNIGKFGLAEQHEDLVWPSLEAFERMIASNYIHESTAMFRRTCCAMVGGFRSDITFAFDWEYWMRIAAVFDIGFLAKPLVEWRKHPKSNTNLNVLIDGKDTINRLPHRLWALRFADQFSQTRGLTFTKQIRECLGQIIYDTGSSVLNATPAKREVRREVLNMCWHYPRLLGDKRTWLILIKSSLPTWAIATFRRIRGIHIEI